MVRRACCVAWIGALLLSQLCRAADLGAFLPLKAKPGGEAGPPTRLRGSHTVMLYAPEKGAPMALRVEAAQIGRYGAEILAHPTHDPATKLVVRPETAGGPASGVLRFEAPKRGVVTVELATSANAAMLTALAPNGWLVYETSQRLPLHVIGRAERLHFFVPDSTTRFAVLGRGAGGRENCRITVFDPAGKQVGQASGHGARTATVQVPVPAEHRGKVWSMRADRPPELDGVFEDAYLWLSDDVPAYVSPQPEGLLVPFCSGLQRPPIWRGKDPVKLTFGFNIEPPEGAYLEATLEWGYRMAPPRVIGKPGKPVTLTVDAEQPLGRRPLTVRLRDAKHKVLAESITQTTLTRTLIFVGEPQALVRAELLKREGQPPALSVQRNIIGADLPLKAQIRLLRTANPETPGRLGAAVALERDLGEVGDEPVVVEPPEKPADGCYQWKVVARSPDGELMDVQFAHFLLRGDEQFAEVPPPPAPPIPVLREGQRGFVAFAGMAADAIVYNHRPQPDDLRLPLRATLMRGEYEPATFGVWAFEDVRGLRVEVSPLKHKTKDATLPVEVRLARHWPQRTSWRTSAFRIIPEMLEPNASFGLALGQLKQIWLTIRADEDAPDGMYRATVTVRDAEGRSQHLPLEVRVRSLRMKRPTAVHWGLYSDSSRWRRYPDAQVRAELADIVAHGITTLMCYPPYHSTATYENGKLTIDASEFVKYMRMAKEAGLRGPWVMSLQGLESRVKRLVPGKPLTDPEFKKVYQGYARFLAELAKREQLGECVWHTIAEPGSKEKQETAAIQLGYMKELGLTTFTTAGPVSPEIDRALDVRCYAISHLLASPAVLAEQRKRTADAGDRLWFYGSGCYTGQDGNAIANRFITGFLFWKSGAEGVWSWTFLRAKGDVHDDFDGEQHREAKEACIVYPSTTGGAPTPTLQWEGIREGIDDYCAIHTILDAGKQVGLEDVAVRHLERLLAEVPVSPRPGRFSAAEAQELHQRIVGIFYGHLCK